MSILGSPELTLMLRDSYTAALDSSRLWVPVCKQEWMNPTTTLKIRASGVCKQLPWALHRLCAVTPAWLCYLGQVTEVTEFAILT